ncbi:hypothetical protein Ae201684P_002837 [Aphanomyces euteiches]|uniref:Transmembrane protein 198 n=1 Tax=Aphanomyces euteiches TaxID=100861 RepID=A0A6G0X5P1_9STRA|nr:hypothetical protein Ae201684_008336 [Aphanomyces euteiches]KAH9070479.1 hypothetical protein Ae201684P_002837 [Aphanomyces euteiches]KAH9157421.1 hypothetical protein AeRB84_000725 [Aphanomyces euteiches]
MQDTCVLMVLLTVVPVLASNGNETALINMVTNLVVNVAKTMATNATLAPANRIPHADSGLLASTGVTQIAVWPALVAGACIGLGLVVTFYGYKLFRATVFGSSFAFGAIVGYMVAERVCNVDASYFYAICWGVFAVCGLITGFLGLYVLRIGVALVGMTGGIVFAFLMTTSFGYKWWPTYPDGILFILMASFGLIFAIVCYALEKPMLIPMMSLTGAGAAVWGIGYFAGGYASADDLSVYRTSDSTYHIPSSFWGYLSATIVLFIVGMLVQFLSTACCENNDLYTWETHADIEMTTHRSYFRRGSRYDDNYVRTRDNYYHAHNHRVGPY